MDKSQLRLALEKWNNVDDFQRLAFELYKAAEGDARKLGQSYVSENGLYGLVSFNLFGENAKLHRYLVWNIWNTNKGNVRDHFGMVAREHGQRKQLKGTPYRSAEVMCWCNFSVKITDGHQLPKVNCRICKKAFHSICAGFSDDVEGDLEYACIVCSNTPAVPKLFRLPRREKTLLAVGKNSNDETFQQRESSTPKRKIADSAKSLLKDMEALNYVEEDSLKGYGAELSQDDVLNIGLGVSGDDLCTSYANLKDDDLLSVHSKRFEVNSDHDNQGYLLDGFDAAFTQEGSDGDFSERTCSPLCSPNKETSKQPDPERHGDENDENNWQTSDSAGSDNESIKGTKKSFGNGSACDKKVDTSKVPTSWTATFTKEEWMNVMVWNPQSRRFSMKKDYGDMLQDKLGEVNPVCVIKCRKRELTQKGDKHFGTKPFLAVYTCCKGKSCQVSHIFTLKDKPDLEQDIVKMEVRARGGPINHNQGEANKRFLKGGRRQLKKDELKHELPSNVYRKGFAKADITKVEKGNHDNVKNLKVFQQARVEVKNEEDFHRDVIIDLLATRKYFQTKLTSKIIPGYIQEVSLHPFIVILYTEFSMQMLRKLSRKGDIALFLDATSSIAKSIEGFDGRKIFYYALVLKSPSNKPVPVVEFFSAQQDFLAINYSLECFFQN